jgi:hypothetical protein
MSRVQPRTYDLAEANAVLPEVRGLVERIVELGTNLPDLEDAVRIAQYRRARANDPGAVDAEHDRHTEALREAELELTGALTTLEAMGVQLKDMRLGLIDFLSYREGELVELCWKLGEDRVAFWHRIGEGFAGRQPIA